jgi:hypothetical protein
MLVKSIVRRSACAGLPREAVDRRWDARSVGEGLSISMGVDE